jgi:MipA family protein
VKYLLIATLLFFTLNAEEEKQDVTMGLGLYVQTQPYIDVSTMILPTPVIFFDNSLLYIRWTRYGVYFLGNKGKDISWGFSLTAQPRTYGYAAEGSKTLTGMDKRESSIEGGLAFSASYKTTYMEITALTDVLSRNDSLVVEATLGDEYKVNKFSFYPSVGISYLSKSFVNYYYGVKNSEETPTRLAYNPTAGIQLTAQSYINYEITDSLDTLVNINARMLPKSAYDSPIVNEQFIYSGLVSLIYTFQY